MNDSIFCGQCDTENPAINKFCGQCGSKLAIRMNVPVKYEYRDFEWLARADREPDCVYARLPYQTAEIAMSRMTESEARVHFWQKYQKAILENFQRWLDAGWQPVSEVGPSCIILGEKSRRSSSLVIGLLNRMLWEQWCFVGATISMRRPQKETQG